MRKFLSFLKYCFYAVASLILLGLATVFLGHKLLFPIPYSETPTIDDIKYDGFCFGVGCQPSASTAEEYMSVFAEQIRRHNEIAPSLWPNNHVVDLHVLVQSIEHNKAWFVSPDGKFKNLTKNQVKELTSNRPRYNIGFSYFEKDSIKGVYLALSEKALTNVLEYQKYQYLGTYDLFLTYSHEMFHMLEQGKVWKSPEVIYNRAKNERFDDLNARAIRNLLYQQILDAVSAPTTEIDSLALIVLATYNNYKIECPDDLRDARYFDKIEGTAHYYEIVSSLYSAYPKQVYSEETLAEALKVIARKKDPYYNTGLITESYTVGAWTCILLDLLQENNSEWKIKIMQNPDLTPLDILAQIYEEWDLPKAQKTTEEHKNNVISMIESSKNKNVAPAIFRMLYQLIF